jgi:hypothetical protein
MTLIGCSAADRQAPRWPGRWRALLRPLSGVQIRGRTTDNDKSPASKSGNRALTLYFSVAG